jgi:hypothetical protein
MNTVIEQLAELLRLRHKKAYDDLIEDIEYFKKIEQSQIEEAWEDGQQSFSSRTPEQYYNETFNQ